MTLRVYLRNALNERIGEIDDFQSLSYTDMWRGLGAWSMEMPPTTPINRFLEPRAGILVYEGDQIVYSGPFTNLSYARDAEKNSLTVSGTSDAIWLARRLATPGPYPYHTKESDYRAGDAETVIKAYLAYNLAQGDLAAFLAPDGPEERKVPITLAPTQGRGSYVEGRARFERLDELVDDLALAGGDMGYSVRQGLDGYPDTQLVFDVHTVTDRTSDFKFSTQLGTLANRTYEIGAPSANWIIVGGEGEDINRMFVEGGDSDSIAAWGRIEGPIKDRRDTLIPSELNQTRDEELARSAESLSVAFTVAETPRVTYGQSFGVGDVVTVEINDVELQHVIREATISYKTDGPRSVELVVGTPGSLSPEVPKFFQQQRNIARRAFQLERRL